MTGDELIAQLQALPVEDRAQEVVGYDLTTTACVIGPVTRGHRYLALETPGYLLEFVVEAR